MGALPAVYTLSSGAQTALGSANCLLHQPPDPMPTRFIDGTAHDTWLRQRVVTGTINETGTQTPVYCVSSPVPPPGGSADGQTYWDTCAANNGQADALSTWVKLDPDGAPVAVDAAGVNPINLNDYTGASAASRRFGLVFVNDQGRMETLNQSGTSDVPITGSCWMSLSP